MESGGIIHTSIGRSGEIGMLRGVKVLLLIPPNGYTLTDDTNVLHAEHLR
jgi:hypothetical protein